MGGTHFLPEIVIETNRSTDWGSIARQGADFVPFVGSGLDIYEGIRDGNGWQVATGVGGMVLDVATMGVGGAIVKGSAKALLKEGAEQGVKHGVKVGLKPVNQLNKLVQTSTAPKGIVRFDKGRNTKKLPQDEVHFKDGSSLYRDGTWRHNKGHNLTKGQIKFLKENGWEIPR